MFVNHKTYKQTCIFVYKQAFFPLATPQEENHRTPIQHLQLEEPAVFHRTHIHVPCEGEKRGDL